MIRWRNTLRGVTVSPYSATVTGSAPTTPTTFGIRRLLLGRTAAALATALIPTTLTLAVVHKGTAAGALGIILTADLTRAAAQGGIGATLLTDGVNVPALAALAAVTGGAVAFGSPAVRTLVSATVSGARRQRLNARLSVWQGLAQFAGPGIA